MKHRQHCSAQRHAIFVLALFFLYITVSGAADLRNLQVAEIRSTATSEEAGKARAAFRKGESIIRMTGGSAADFERLVGVRISDTRASSAQSQIRGTGPREEMKLRGVAAYIDQKGIVRTLLSFAPGEAEGGKQVDAWIARAQSMSSAASLGDPTPPSEAWTPLYSSTVLVNDGQGSAQSTDSIFRLNVTNADSDYYLVYTVPEAMPDYTKDINGPASVCDGLTFCGSHTIGRDFTISLTAGNSAGSLIDHGPTGTISGSSVGFNIGASLSAQGPGISAGFSASWSQSSVSTVDQSTSETASWKENFDFSGDPCLPVVNTIPGVSSGTFLSRQGAIFQVPGGQSTFNVSITQNTQFCKYIAWIYDLGDGTLGKGPYHDTLTLQKSYLLGNPLLDAREKSMTIPAGGSQPLAVIAYIPNSDEGVTWKISSNTSWLTVPSSDCYSSSEVLSIGVTSTINDDGARSPADGAQGTLSLDTCTPFGAPSVARGPITVNVTVGDNPQVPSAAGLLLVGGAGANSPNPAEYYDLSYKVSLPVTPKTVRVQNMTSTLLKTGSVLVAGGMTDTDVIPPTPPAVTAAAELFNPATLTFTDTGSLATARAAHTATLLPDGKVLIVGGLDANSNLLSSAELYDPVTGKFTSAGNLKKPRAYHYANLQLDIPYTRVIFYGGFTTDAGQGQDAPDGSYEIWDETLGFFQVGDASPVANAPQPVSYRTTAEESNVITTFGIVSGQSGVGQLTTASYGLQFESFDGGWGFTAAPAVKVARMLHALAPLPDQGGFLVTGGITSTSEFVPLATAELSTDFSQSGSWSLLSGTADCPGSPGCMQVARAGHTSTLLPDGTVFIAGGTQAQPYSEIFDPVSKTFTMGPPIKPRIFHSATLVVTRGTSLLTSPPTSTFGQKVHLSATVDSRAGTPTGTIQFFDGSTSLGSAPLDNGQAAIDVTDFSVGSHSLTAVYSGDAMADGSTSPPVLQQVSAAATTTSLSVSSNPSNVGEAITLTSSVNGAGGPVTGTVVFSDGTTQIASANLVDGTAKAQVSSLSLGQHSLTATYNSQANWTGSTSAAIVQQVNPASVNTTTTLNSSNNPSTSGEPVTFQAQVNPTSGTGVPTGTVRFLDGSILLGSATLFAGVASFPISTLTVGTHAITASYGGDSNGFVGSYSTPLKQTVNKASKVATTTALTSNPNPSNTGSAVTLTATVTPSFNSGNAPTGNVIFTDQTTSTALGVAQLSTVNGVQVAVLTTNALTTGAHTLTAGYQGDSNFSASVSAPYAQAVSGSGGGKVTPAIDLTVNGGTSATVNAGASVTFVARIHAPPGYPVPTGSITISDSTNANNRYGSGIVTKDPNSTDGLATIVVTGTPEGGYTIVATYGGDNQGLYYNGNQSNVVALTVHGAVGEPLPMPDLAVAASPGPRNGAVVPVSLKLTNNGAAAARVVTLNQIQFRTIAGAGQATLISPSLPLVAGDLAPGASTVITLQVEVPQTVRRISISEGGIFTDASGATRTFSPGQTIIP